ncbi:hypothetical protein ACFLIM_45450 [Nonomuraea sp. M3C6]|uniref:NADH:flavin oxidoreductase/NADH oxidase N-terminal domain-containing protein n=1 Tax=Nonomuraea marmarensis TaxID=3351344 RepID=A0ABW7AW42_9ACTN
MSDGGGFDPRTNGNSSWERGGGGLGEGGRGGARGGWGDHAAVVTRQHGGGAGSAAFVEAPAVGPQACRRRHRRDWLRHDAADHGRRHRRVRPRLPGRRNRRASTGVELHGAHGCLIDQFLWARTNRRMDAYGGDLVACAKFVVEIVTAVREAVSLDLPVALRYSHCKQDACDAKLAGTPEELKGILTPLVAAGVDVFQASTVATGFRHSTAPT